MSVTREKLEALGIEGDTIDKIIAAHLETVNGLKDKCDRFENEANEAKRKLEDLSGDKNAWKIKYDALKEDFDSYKTSISAKETTRAKQAAYREALKAAGVSDKRIDSIIKVSDVDSVELDESGKIKEADKLTESIKTEWADFIVSTNTQGANTATPPTTSKKSFSREDIDKMSSAEINENWETIKNSLKEKAN